MHKKLFTAAATREKCQKSLFTTTCEEASGTNIQTGAFSGISSKPSLPTEDEAIDLSFSKSQKCDILEQSKKRNLSSSETNVIQLKKHCLELNEESKPDSILFPSPHFKDSIIIASGEVAKQTSENFAEATILDNCYDLSRNNTLGLANKGTDEPNPLEELAKVSHFSECYGTINNGTTIGVTQSDDVLVSSQPSTDKCFYQDQVTCLNDELQQHIINDKVAYTEISTNLKDTQTCTPNILIQPTSSSIKPIPRKKRFKRKPICDRISQCNNMVHNISLEMTQTLEENSAADEGKKEINANSSNALITNEALRSRITQQSDMDSSEIEEILEGMDDEINNMLEQTAQKNKLSATNVKNILRHVITNEYVLAMVRNTMKSGCNDCDDLEEAVFEPKLTRSKAKELREKQAVLPWPVSSPLKLNNQLVSKKLLEEEFSDDESTSDEEYRPNEEECRSEEDENAQLVKANTSVSSLPNAPDEYDTTASPPDISVDFSPLVIALPEIPDIVKNVSKKIDKIALRTRSKLSLNDTPLETIEASFIAPDITVDMYDTECDDEDWQKFLCDFTKPLDQKVTAEQLDDDGDDDPEYNFFEEEDVLDKWDLRNDKAVKIPKTELNALMVEILEAAEQELNELEDEEEEETSKDDGNCMSQKESILQAEKIFENSTSEQVSHWFSAEERLQLEEQMRMHVQLLCQSFLLSYGDSHLQGMNESSKMFLEELKMFSSRELCSRRKSMFYAINLDEALNIIKGFQSQHAVHIQLRSHTKKAKGCPSIQNNEVKRTLAHNKAFIYPDLLPIVGFQRSVASNAKIGFTPAEDNLIALGLEQFSPLVRPVQWIHTLLVPAKTEQQIKFRIKNCKTARLSSDNPIKYYYMNKQAPLLPKAVRPFYPENRAPPSQLPVELLPKWMICYSNKPSPIAPGASPSKVAVVHPLIQKTPEKRKYSPILPRGHVSPLKQISPILKKYVHHRRALPITPYTAASALCIKPVGFAKRQSRRPLAIKPHPEIAVIRNVCPIPMIPQFVQIKRVENALITIPSSIPETGAITTSVLQSEIETQSRLLANQSEVNQISMTNGDLPLNNITEMIMEPASLESSKDNQVPQSQQNTQSVAGEINVEECQNTNGGTESEPQTELDACDDGDEEVVDDEQDLAALMAASSTICKKQQHPVIKKKNKHQRDLESTLALLCPQLIESDPKKAEREKIFAQSYLLRVSEALKNDPESYENFLKTLCSYEYSNKSPVQLYLEVKDLLKEHPSLSNDFIGFLRPEQAKDCGKFVEYSTLSKIRGFLRKMEIHFSQQPHHIQRILRTFSQLQHQTDITSSAVISALQPLLRNQTHLLEEFLQLMPDEAPPECLMMDFEEIRMPNSEGENASDDSVEEIIIPESADPYGCKECPCVCHSLSTDIRMQNRSRHCAKCGTKFLDGRIYIQTGKVLKPAQVIYHSTTDGLPQEIISQPTSQVKGNNNKNSHESDSPLSSPNCSPCPQHPTDDDQQDHRHDMPKITHSKGASDNLGTENRMLIELAPKTHSIPKCSVKYKDKPKKSSKSPEHILQGISGNLCHETCNSPSVPCDVIEDAVLPPDSSCGFSSIPSDFSHLREVISLETVEQPHDASNVSSVQKNNDIILVKQYSQKQQILDCIAETKLHQTEIDDSGNIVNETADLNTKNNTFSSMQYSSGNESKISSCLNTNNDSLVSAANLPFTNHLEIKWTREQDKLILQACQNHGVTEEAFLTASRELGSISVQQIENRFHTLMQLFAKHLQEEPES